MNNTLIPTKFLLCCACITVSFAAHAISSSTIEEQANTTIKQLYQTTNNLPNASMAERIDWFSAQFKGKSYLVGSLGEGPNARFDQFPRYRTDAFDCDTYVNTVISLALASSAESFQRCIKMNRYKNGTVSYIYRNHFTSLDWNQNNQQRGVLRDITLDIKDQQKKPVAQYAEAIIDKTSWYAHKTLSTIRLQNNNTTEKEQRLSELKAKGAHLGAKLSKMPYIPLTTLFSEGKPNLYLFSQIPQGAIIEIIRPNWDLRKVIGTSLNVSHLGFAIWVKDQLYYRDASSEAKKVIDVPLIDYLKDALKSPTIKGINIQVLVPERPLNSRCEV